MGVFPRGAGVAIVRDEAGRFIGRVIRVGTSWQTFRTPEEPGPMLFVGWSPTRRAAVGRLR